MISKSQANRKPLSNISMAVQTWLADLIFGSRLIFNQTWEDPAVDREALALSKQDVLFTIASAGDNTLALALDSPKKIYAVDLNPAQIYLLQLRIAAAQHLVYADFWHLFSLVPAPHAHPIYHGHLRSHLARDAQEYWDRHLHLFQRGLTRAGVFGRTLWLLRTYLKVVCGPHVLEGFFDMRSLPEQADYYKRRIHAPWWNPLARPFAGQLPVLLMFGAHPHQVHRIHGQQFASFLAASIERALTTLPVQNNFFWQQVFLGRYLIPPDYARPENFARLKTNVFRIETHIGRAQDYLRVLPPTSVTRFNLLDAPDWLSPLETIELWDLIQRAAAPGAKVLFRTIDPSYRLPNPILAFCQDETDPAWVTKDRTGVYAKVCLYALD